MADRTYTPTMGMVRELARASLGHPCVEDLERDRCRRRGLIGVRGLTASGHDVLNRAAQQFEQFEARHG